MNSKRQTVWLVSMLSLMVILSAYYLFTGDSKPNGLTDTAQTEETNPGATEVLGTTNTSEIQTQEVTGSTDDVAQDTDDSTAVTDNVTPPSTDAGKTSTDSGTTSTDGTEGDSTKTPATGAEKGSGTGTDAATGKDGAKASSTDAGMSPEDMAVLQQLESQTASAEFNQLGEASQTRVSQQYDKILEKISDVTQDADGSTKALAELDQFESRQDQIESLRKELEATYKNVVIDENGKSVKVVVQSQKLAKSQAAAIITKVSTALNVNAGDILVKYLP